MQSFKVEDVLRATKGKLLSGENKEIKGVITDSRKVFGGELFIPFKGERADGHDYIKDVLKKGAAAALSQEDIKTKGTLIKVDDTLTALGALAKEYLKMYRIPVVGVTGSVGKTSTKDMISGVLESKYNVLKSTGNHNNEIGMPLTVFDMEKEHNMAVFDMGMSAFGELNYLADIARPDVAVITNIGMSHIENLGSQEGILKAKLEMCDFFEEDNVLFVNGDDKFLKDVSGEFKVIRYGMGKNCDIQASDIDDRGILGTHFTITVSGKHQPVYVKAPGVHNVYNAMAAIGIGMHYGISLEAAAKAVEEVVLTDMRMTIEEISDVTILKDFYNAAPDSVRASLSVLKSVKEKRRVAVLGDILELGDFSKEEHRKLGDSLYECADVLVTAGENAKFIADGANALGMKEVYEFDNTDEAARNIKSITKPGDCILIKASRGMRFEKIYEKYEEK